MCTSNPEKRKNYRLLYHNTADLQEMIQLKARNLRFNSFRCYTVQILLEHEYNLCYL